MPSIQSLSQPLFDRSGRAIVLNTAGQLPIPPDFSRGDYAQERVLRGAFHQRLEAIWEFKDPEINTLLGYEPLAMVA